MTHILIVDDNLTNLEQLNIQLEDEFEVSLAKSGPQALQICRSAKPDLVLLDIEMPGMDGFEALAAIKADPSISHIPVILLTASPETKTELRAIREGASDFLAKPVERELLLHGINTQLLFAESKERRDAMLRDFEDRLIIAFSDIIEHRNEIEPVLAGRASKYVRIIGDTLLGKGAYPEELNHRAVELMTRASPLHDFGKIGIPDVILMKPSLLNDDEFSLMKTHTVMGETHLRRVFRLLPRQDFHDYALVMARSHHERWDGKGYPDGLSKDGIPLCARIMAVADVFDALVDARPYKRTMGIQEAFRTISAERGTVFDPAIADAFLEAEEKVTEATWAGQDG
ncbi:MAG: response regulator [Deltaproteobacteria bacterium]|jgi:putative two-component system response regulator|nr:response regulator [Deltaproteobacteria bacterium]